MQATRSGYSCPPACHLHTRQSELSTQAIHSEAEACGALMAACQLAGSASNPRGTSFS